MKYSEIKDLNLAEIQKRLTQNKQILFDARIKHKMQRQSNPLQLRFLKRDISRLQTVLSTLPASAFKSSTPKKVTPTADTQKKVQSQPVKTVVKKTEKKQKKEQAPAVVESKEKKDKEKTKPMKKKSWFGFMGLKSKQDKNLKAVSKKSFFRRKSG